MTMRPFLFIIPFLVLSASMVPYVRSQDEDGDDGDDDVDDDERMYYLGLSKEEYDELVVKVIEMRKLQAKVDGKEFDENDPAVGVPIDDDVILTLEIVEDRIEKLREQLGEVEPSAERSKRAVFDKTIRLWGTTIKYSLSSNYTKLDRDVIRKGLRHIMRRTCLEFKEVKRNPDIRIMNTRDCSSYVGHVFDPQPLYLRAPGCTGSKGITIHEFGHALGLWHEQQHPNRDDYVDVEGRTGVNYDIHPNSYTSIQYDFQSIMHYSGIITKDPKFQTTVGQSSELSFYDAEQINKRYCQCVQGSSAGCMYGGYRVGPKCFGNCQCRDGLGGRTCQKFHRNEKECKPKVHTATKQVKYLSSPGYGGKGYRPSTRCTWVIQEDVPGEDCRIAVWFDPADTFEIFSRSGSVCHNWLEIKLNGYLSQGQRFCRQGPINFYGKSTSQLVLVNFRTFLEARKTYNNNVYYKGFKIYYRAVDCYSNVN